MFSKYRLTLCLGSVMMAILPTVAVAQEEAPSQFEHVKGLKPFVGIWSGTMQPPGGPETQLTMSCRWTCNKSYAKFEITMRNEDGRNHVGTIIIGRSAKVDGLYMWAFWPDRLSTGTATVEANKLSYTGTGPTLDGVDVSADVEYQVDGDDLKVSVTNSRRGDSEQPDFEVTLKRQERAQR